MKLRNILLAASAICAFAAPAFAQTPPPPPGHFDRVDTNRDGAISRDEARVAHVAKFNEIDTNRDSFLSAEELRANHNANAGRGRQMVQEHVVKMHEQRTQQRTQRFDADNNGTISRQEWENGPTRERELAQKMHKERFDKIDTNKDGQLSLEELNAGRAAGHGQMHQRRGGAMGQGIMGQGVMGQGAVQERPMPNQAGPRPNRADTNNDGKVSRAEWDAMQDGIFAAGDLNKDGRITREEAAQAARNRPMREGKMRQGGQGGQMFKTAPNTSAN